MLASQVALRIRPLSDIEIEEGAAIVAHRVDDQVRVWNPYVCINNLTFAKFHPLKDLWVGFPLLFYDISNKNKKKRTNTATNTIITSILNLYICLSVLNILLCSSYVCMYDLYLCTISNWVVSCLFLVPTKRVKVAGFKPKNTSTWPQMG